MEVVFTMLMEQEALRNEPETENGKPESGPD
jgi:hypothetical protein